MSFLCSDIDNQIPAALMNIQVDPDLLPVIRDVYTQDVAEQLGHLRPDERERLQSSLKMVDEEEGRMARLYAAGKITDAVWDSLWREWQDRRNVIRSTLESLQYQHKTHIANLDTALQMISQIGIVYNSLERSDQKELLHHIVSRVVIDCEGIINLELRAPFSYLQDIRNWIRNSGDVEEIQGYSKTKTSSKSAAGFVRTECSLTVLSCGSNRNLSEQSPSLNRSTFIQRIQFPHYAHLVRLSTLD
ncbi:MAG: hypothetical protein BroJett021_51340 [Chloroflexota bacterium]|nr:MAG: hypothetical protein BroJett021_51340 [Chloroflexota bacterium]